MATLKERIDSYLQRHPGTLAKEMADYFGVTRKEVNSVIYANKNDYKQDSSYRWYLASSPLYMDAVLMKLNNVSNAKEFTEKDFEALADWKSDVSQPGTTKAGVHVFANGDTVKYGSDSERIMLQYLDENNLVIRCGGQALQIKYDTVFAKGRTYIPDIVVLTKMHHIAIIEVKSSTAMSYHLNLEKYRALSEYCEKHGFEYMMIDPADDYKTIDEISEMGVLPELLEYFNRSTNGPRGYRRFTDKMVDKWYRDFGSDLTKKEFNLQIHSLIIYYNWFNLFSNGFKVYSCPVKLDKDFNAVEVATNN